MESTKQDAENKIVSYNQESAHNNNQQHSFWRGFATKTAIYTGTTALVGLYAVPALCSWIGFSAIGVTAGSWAAYWQSTHLLCALFGYTQSVTATGAVSLFVTKCGVTGSVLKAYNDAKKKQAEQEANIEPTVQSKL